LPLADTDKLISVNGILPIDTIIADESTTADTVITYIGAVLVTGYEYLDVVVPELFIIGTAAGFGL
jgi:hypothetical protein